MTAVADLSVLPAIPRDAEGPVFREPWEARAFAMAVQLNARGVFAWTVVNTKWPVSAALIAICAVSASRISPTRILSGS